MLCIPENFKTPAFLLQNNLWEFTTPEHNSKDDFWYTTINLTQIWYDEFN